MQMSKKKQPIPIEDKTEEELAYIIDVINNSALPDYIKAFIILCIETALWFPHVLQKKNMSLKRLKFMLFGKSYKSGYKIKSKIPLDNNIANDNDNSSADAKVTIVDLTDANFNSTVTSTHDIEAIVNNPKVPEAHDLQDINTLPGHGRMAHTRYKDSVEYTLNIEDLKSGDACPLDCGGKVYEFKPKMPKVLLRIVGQKVAEVRKIIVQRLRCNLCHYLIQAEIPAWVGTEKYDAGFKAWVVLQKYRVAVPFYRQENFQKLLDFPLPDATQWDLVEKVAGFCYQVFDSLTVMAANSDVIHKDDTRVRIQEIIKEIKSNPNIERTGMFTSGFMAENHGHKIALFFNGTKHAGENMTSLLSKRTEDKTPSIQMCDA
jgi:hypothetical protein